MKIKTDFGLNTFKAKNEKTGDFSRKNKYYESGQVQSWNKFCFTGGIIEGEEKHVTNERMSERG